MVSIGLESSERSRRHERTMKPGSEVLPRFGTVHRIDGWGRERARWICSVWLARMLRKVNSTLQAWSVAFTNKSDQPRRVLG